MGPAERRRIAFASHADDQVLAEDAASTCVLKSMPVNRQSAALSSVETLPSPLARSCAHTAADQSRAKLEATVGEEQRLRSLAAAK
jgi:hypothetical protein